MDITLKTIRVTIKRGWGVELCLFFKIVMDKPNSLEASEKVKPF